MEVYSKRRSSMTQILLYGFYAVAVLEWQNGISMTKVVKTTIRKPYLFGNGFEIFMNS